MKHHPFVKIKWRWVPDGAKFRSLILLITTAMHELYHFASAKLFGVQVGEVDFGHIYSRNPEQNSKLKIRVKGYISTYYTEKTAIWKCIAIGKIDTTYQYKKAMVEWLHKHRKLNVKSGK